MTESSKRMKALSKNTRAHTHAHSPPTHTHTFAHANTLKHTYTSCFRNQGRRVASTTSLLIVWRSPSWVVTIISHSASPPFFQMSCQDAIAGGKVRERRRGESRMERGREGEEDGGEKDRCTGIRLKLILAELCNVKWRYGVSAGMCTHNLIFVSLQFRRALVEQGNSNWASVISSGIWR